MVSAMFNEDEKMFIKQAIYKSVADDVKTGKANARGAFDERYRQRYRETGGKSYDALLVGRKVGTVSVVPDNPKPKPTFTVTDPDALDDWYATCEDAFREYIVSHMDDFAKWHFERTGELPDGCSFEMARPEPKEPTVRLSISVDDVVAALDALPGGVSIPMLGGGA